jgi:hypothetical protein
MFDLPPDLDVNDPLFIPTLNDRLRRLQGGTVTVNKTVQNVPDGKPEDYDRATFIIFNSAVGTSVTNILQIRRAFTPMETTIAVKVPPTSGSVVIDIRRLDSTKTPATIASIYQPGQRPTFPSTTPANTLITPTTVLAGASMGKFVDDLVFHSGDILFFDIATSDGSAQFTAIVHGRT